MGANEFASMPHIGEALRRVEDTRFLTGAGKYVDDIHQEGQKYACFVRSPHAHALIKSMDTAAAAAMPGVRRIYTGQDIEGKVGGLPTGWLISNPDGSPMKEPPHPFLAIHKVRYVGEPVAMVVADTLEQARNAAEAVSADYEELQPVVDMAKAAQGPALHDEAPDNRCYKWVLGDKAAVDATFAGAAHVTRLDLVNNRLVPNAMEPRADNARHDRASGETLLYTTSQNPHLVRLLLSAFVLNVPEHKLRVIAPDVGGGFGSKINLYPEDVAITWAARELGCAVKWTAERSESFIADTHGRDHISHAEMALDKDGKFLALRVHSDANLGAYLATFGPVVPTILYGTLLAGQYTTPQIYVEVDGWFTNTVPVDAYRGAGRPEAAYLVERLVTRCAWELGIGQDEIRRRNFITEFPYQTPVALQYDTGDFPKCLEEARKLADVAGFDERRRASEAKGLKRGIGYSSYIEACGLAPSHIVGQLGGRAGLYECGEVRINPTGSVTVFTGTHSHGQGHETAFAQLVAARLGIAVDAVEVVHGDTGRIPFGMGTYGSRSLAVGGAAVMKALDKIEEKAKKIAAHLMEASDADIEFTAGEFRVKGTDKKKAFGEVALAAYVPHNYPLDKLEPGLDETAFYDPSNFTYPAGTHICEVEVDPATGAVHVDRFTAVDDFGVIVNPMIVEGQVQGGVMQGIGQALLEECAYDSSGQLLSGSYMDYTMPRAKDFPEFRLGTVCTPCTHNPLGSKGCGEAGTIGSPPAVINALLDALEPLGVHDIDMPATPHRVWQAIQAAR
ncbi:xanthine dehydrogenase family protein molybdopterin-binding subunit [Candidimonas nitroreducens]|uniref:Carbon monoxide dehydrogenase n=1 Tax=Candidimonas nitroreducens TaxID=683354 RepID=A0A225M865_9BURK|nr:xanthine dehydrogenase family protein molybdopterin-binding subunit [Candidimonas nitroreducens]OWT57527.1 carbon monoxide dehydrogenase [Candidimonas nitroreducens]